MKKVFKVLALTMAVCLLAMAIAGCGSTGTTAPSASPAATAGGTIKVGTNAEFPPFEFKSGDKFDGIDMAISDDIAKAAGKTLEINNMEFDSLLIALQQGQIDMIAAGMTVTDERKASVDFSEPYYTANQVMIVKEDTTIKTAEDLKDKKIGVVNGYTGDFVVTEDMKLNPERFKKGADAVMDLVNGKLDVVVIDSTPAQMLIANNKSLKIIEDEKAFEKEEFAIAVKKGNTELLATVNKVLAELKANGKINEYSQKYEKYIQEDAQ